MVEQWLLYLHRHWKCSDRSIRLIRKGLNSNDASKAFVEDLSLDKKTFDIDGLSCAAQCLNISKTVSLAFIFLPSDLQH